MDQKDDSAEKSHEASPRKLEQARKKGDIPRAPDLLTAFGYLGFLLCGLTIGSWSIQTFGDGVLPLIEQPDRLEELFLSDGTTAIAGGLLQVALLPMLPIFLFPAMLIILALIATRGLTFTGSKLAPKASRLSPIENAKNKFGRRGLFEFFKSFVKLSVYSVILAIFIWARLEEIVGSARATPVEAVITMLKLMMQFLGIVVIVAGVMGLIDFFWQRSDHLRRNRMSHKEMRDEFKEAEGDPMLRQQRRFRAQEIAMNQMMADVPKADVVIVNPTHFAVVLQWSRMPGSAPVVVAKGVDSVAFRIREVALDSNVPIHSDPPTARALHATTEIGQEISTEHYKPVAAAIRFAEKMRIKSKKSVFH